MIIPKVSVIILTRNRPQLLKRAVLSVINQTYQEFEIIIIDDASTDETPQVVGEFQDSRIILSRNDVSKGESGARNVGLGIAKGKYVAFLDDDDEWLQGKLEAQVSLMENTSQDVGGVYTGFYEWDLDKKEIVGEMIPKKKGNIYEDMFVKNWVGTPSTVLLKRTCFQNVGSFDENISYGPDYDMWIRVAKKYEFEYIAQPLVRYGVHNQQMSKNHENMVLGREKLLEKHREFFLVEKNGQSEFWLKLGVWYCYNKSIHKGIKTFWLGMRKYPHDIRFYYNIGLAVMGERIFRIVKEGRDRYLGNVKW